MAGVDTCMRSAHSMLQSEVSGTVLCVVKKNKTFFISFVSSICAHSNLVSGVNRVRPGVEVGTVRRTYEYMKIVNSSSQNFKFMLIYGFWFVSLRACALRVVSI